MCKNFLALFKNKYDKLSRNEVVDAICDLEKQGTDLEEQFSAKSIEIEELLNKGRSEKSDDLKIFWAKKINGMKTERANCIQRALFSMYNITLLKKLKDAIDDNAFISNIGKIPLNKLLADQKGLARFLNKALNTKLRTEDIMTSADSVFNEVRDVYEPSKIIYGANENDDQLLAMFETEDSLEMEKEIVSVNVEEKKGDLSVNVDSK